MGYPYTLLRAQAVKEPAGRTLVLGSESIVAHRISFVNNPFEVFCGIVDVDVVGFAFVGLGGTGGSIEALPQKAESGVIGRR